eukprot:Phypoly_transcript_10199.p1 GENE.Phypoly_transcript_10199~~Phypoly_transcript_10199.p1  ORF type:complete len:410 (+),score=48.78 Phypoly_transcript_10199:36-1265(+)
MGDKKSSRPFGIVVWGATGYTGNLICEYLITHNPANVKWAIAGRSQSKLESVRQELTKTSPSAKNIEIFTGDVDDQPSIDAIAKQTRVILSCAGPYSAHGTPIVASCVRNGTDYCDITGEFTWVRKLVAAYEEDARRTGSLIVNCCGFDCIPSDLGTFFVTSHVKKTYGVNSEDVKVVVTKLKGGASGGTIGTILAMIDTGSLKGARDPYYLIPNNSSKVKQPNDLMSVEFDNDLKLWKYPHPLAACDNRVVRRAQYLMGYPNGEFSFRATSGTSSFVKAFVATVIISIAFIALQFKFVRGIVSKLFPPGSGPKKQNLHKGCAEVIALAKTEKNSKSGVPEFAKARVFLRGDPGYLVTATMVTESALCLATQRDILPAKQGGIHTASSSMGMLLVERLQNAGIIFEIEQ